MVSQPPPHNAAEGKGGAPLVSRPQHQAAGRKGGARW